MAEIKPSYDTKRTNMRDVIPLHSPLSMYIEPTRMCNLKCFYCMHATRGKKGGELEKTGFKIKHLDRQVWEKIVADIMSFPEQPKRVCFSGLGEPLMNPDLPVMISDLRNDGFTGRIDIITNGILLTPATSEALIKAGINRIQISVQALSGERYKEIAGVRINMDSYIDNIEHLYKNKNNAEVFIKIIDANLKNEKEKKLFFDIYNNICDYIYIEHLVIMQHQMANIKETVNVLRNLNNEPYTPRECCGIMYYFLQVNTDGDTYPCSTPGLPAGFSMGNVKTQTLQDIWNGDKRNKMLRQNLISGYKSFHACKECSSVICITDPAENIDDFREQLLARLPETN